MDVEKYLWLSLYVFGFSLMPGPGTAAILATALRIGFWRGLIFSLGEASGDLFYASLAMVTLGAAQIYVESLVIWIKYLGAAYIIWLGWRQFNSLPGVNSGQNLAEPTAKKSPTDSSVDTPFKLYMGGALVSLANPKLMIFYASFFPLFVPLATITLSETIMVLAVVEFSALIGVGIITACGGALQAINQNPFYAKLMARMSGLVIMGVGVFIACEDYIVMFWKSIMGIFTR
ncbi:MAG: LysE family translocator [Alphaproteobacteria bacterium]|nr:LysE family translocator [Alphaproteobacteria bacterium]